MRVGRRYKFRAKHHVPGLPEPWGSPHWHNYTVEVVFTFAEGAPLLVNHEDLDRLWAVARKDLEGADLNAVYDHTTVEALAEEFRNSFRADEVTVWEDDDRWATAR